MTTAPTTTFARIKAAGPCRVRYKLALRRAGGLRIYGEDTPITVRQIVENMGLGDALWCLGTMPEYDTTWRLYAVRCARQVQHLMADPRSIAALDVAEQAAARPLARHAAWHAAWAAAQDAAQDPARDPARHAAWAAAWAGAWDPARHAAWHAAWAAAQDAAWAAAGDATWDPARHAAWHAARDAARKWQASELIRICEQKE